MLVISRRVGEQFTIGENIVVTITRIKGHCVGIGIQAPSDVRILRSELDPYENDIPIPKLEPVA